jgi:hypothetical protein
MHRSLTGSAGMADPKATPARRDTWRVCLPAGDGHPQGVCGGQPESDFGFGAIRAGLDLHRAVDPRDGRHDNAGSWTAFGRGESGDGWLIEPLVQPACQAFDFDEFNDGAAEVQCSEPDSLAGRIGARWCAAGISRKPRETVPTVATDPCPCDAPRPGCAPTSGPLFPGQPTIVSLSADGFIPCLADVNAGWRSHDFSPLEMTRHRRLEWRAGAEPDVAQGPAEGRAVQLRGRKVTPRLARLPLSLQLRRKKRRRRIRWRMYQAASAAAK